MNNEILKSASTEQAGLDDKPVSPSYPHIEKFIEDAYAQNLFASKRKETLIAELDKDDFQEDAFRYILNSWNENEEKTKGFSGESHQIENLRFTNGELIAIYYPSSGAIRFGYNLPQTKA